MPISDLIYPKKDVPETPPQEAPNAPSMSFVMKKKQEESVIHPLRTYERDIKEAIQTQNMSSIKIALAESKKKQTQEVIEQAVSISSTKNKIFLIISIILIVAAGAVIFYLLSTSKTPVTPIENIVTEKTIIPINSRVIVNTTQKNNDQIIQAIVDELNKEVPANTFEEIYFVKDVATTSEPNSTTTTIQEKLTATEFLNIMQLRTPGILERALEDDYIIGVYSQDGKSLVASFKTNSYENAYSGMLQWEKDSVPILENIFIPQNINLPLENTPQSTSSTVISTTISNISPVTRSLTFEDKIIKNIDTRVIKDNNQQSKIVYGFADKNTIIISSSENAFIEAVNRYNSNKFVR